MIATFIADSHFSAWISLAFFADLLAFAGIGQRLATALLTDCQLLF